MKKSKNKGKSKLRIKPMKYTLMELRKINYCKRKGIPVPQELLDKKFEDFVIEDKVKEAKPQLLQLQEVNESNDSKENDTKIQNNKLLVIEDIPKSTPSVEPEKVSLIKIGIAPKLGGDGANNANSNKPINAEVMTIQIEKKDTAKANMPKQKTTPAQKKK